jgi:hypothetical protein
MKWLVLETIFVRRKMSGMRPRPVLEDFIKESRSQVFRVFPQMHKKTARFVWQPLVESGVPPTVQ